MRRLVLTRPVDICGRDFWGRKARVILEPTETAGWFWYVDGEDVPLHPSLVHIAKRRLVLRHGTHEMHVFEHLGALRFTGLDGVRIRTYTPWLPYDGRALMYWGALAPYLQEDGVLQPMQKSMRGHILRKEGMTRDLYVNLTSSPTLRVSSRIDYPVWGSERVDLTFPGADDLREVLAAKPLARPSWLYPVAWCAGCFGWPHRDNVLWAQGKRPAVILQELALHRMLDLLGAMSVIPRAGEYPTGSIDSDCGNHATDVALLRQLEGQLG